ncbi:hypothetical protein ACG9XR_04050 [Acinetobacter guillouiae]|uniref:hypothetical protein n=1 Tax=Acinetobacter guillouiae TaxID=106649 RepID=UPI003AF8FC99
MSVLALLACTSFYSALYLIYFYFAQQPRLLFLVLAVVLFVFAYRITPAVYQKERQTFNRTLNHRNWLTLPLYTCWQLFILPIRLLLSKFLD